MVMTQTITTAAGVIACILVCWLAGVLVAFNRMHQDTTMPAAKVAFAEGRSRALKGGTSREIRVGDELLPEDLIVTGAEATVLLELSDGSRFQVFAS